MQKAKVCLISFLVFFSVSNFAWASGDTFQGYIEKQKSDKNIQSEVFTGAIDKLDRKDVIKMTVSRVIDSDSSKTNEEFFAEIAEDILGQNGILIPRGTVAHGRIKKVLRARKFARNGELKLSFDSLITPDGREISISGEMSTRLHPLSETSEMIKTNAVYATAGAAAGGLLALNWFGVGGAVSSNGTTIAGGATLGSSIGLGMAFIQKGKDVLISPQDEIIVKLNSSCNLPVYKKNAFHQQEINLKDFNVKINDITYKKSLWGKTEMITLSLAISNMTNETFSIFDIAIVDNFNTAYYPNVFENEKLSDVKIKPNDTLNLTVPFAVDNVKNNFWLTFYNSQTKEVVAKISLDNAYNNISHESIKQNNKLLEKKKDFYKEASPFDSD